MSLKPKKVSEIKKEQAKWNKKMEKRRKIILDDIPPYTFIVSEGIKTEVAYIAGFASAINKKYANFTTGEMVKIKGTGRNCQSLLEYARKVVDDEMPQASIVWLMYDKDDFPLDNFDNTQFSVEQRLDTRTFKAAWSNESLELWFVLHFQELTTNVGRDKYIEILERHCGYKKNDPNLFELMKANTDIAISRAKKQYESYPIETPASQRCPATKVFELVEELKKYL